MTELVWLIDMGYVTKASKGRGKIDYTATLRFLQTRFGQPCLPIIFNSVDSFGVDLGLNQFYYTMKKAGFLVKLYPMEGGVQRQVDVAIASHLVFYALKNAHVVLSSGDIDLVPAVEMVREHDEKIPVTLLTFDLGVHGSLRKLSSAHLLFEDHPETMRA